MLKWIKFLLDYTDGEGKKFTKGQIVQVDAGVADALLKLKQAEETTDPGNDVISKALEPLTKSLEDKLEKTFTACIDEMNKAFKGVKVPAIAKDEKLEKMGGFHDDGEFVEAIIKASQGNVDKRLQYVSGDDDKIQKAPSGQHTRDDVLGGYLVPEDISDRILEIVFDEDDALNILPMTDINYCSGNSLKMTTIPETSRKEGYRDAGVIAYWLEEAGQYTASTVKVGQQRMELNKVIALLYATDEQIEDAGVAMGSIFTRKAGSAIRFKTIEAFWNGTGVGQPMGILRANSTITVPLEDGQSASQAVILHKNVNKMYHRVAPKYRAGARWYVHPDTLEQLEYISFNDDNTNKRPIYMPPNGLSQTPFGTLKGLPVVPWEHCFDAGQRGDIALINWSAYQTLQKRGRTGVRSAQSIHVRFLFDEQAFKFSYRVDGKSALPSPIEDLHGTTKRSNAVVLEARTSEGSSSGL